MTPVTDAAPMKPARELFFGWRMVALAFVAYNAGLTLVVNTFGPALLVMERDLHTSRAGISLGFGLFMLAMGVLAPVVGNLARKFSLRSMMMTGAAVNAVGYLSLAFAGSLPEVLLLYGTLIGAGSCLIGLICAPTLISRWFERDRGKALGVGLMQAVALVAAPLAAWLLSLGGRSFLFFSLAGLFAILVPVMSLVIDRPEAVGQTQRRVLDLDAAHFPGESLKSNREILTDTRFWLLSVVIGVFTAAGITLASHGTAMAAGKGVDLTMASLVLSATGAGTLMGALCVGWLIDRAGPFRALIGALLFTALIWLVFSQVSPLSMMVGLGFLMGACMGPTAALHSACINEIFGAENFSRVMGYSYFVKVPFLCGPAPLAGRLYDLSKGYGSTYAVVVGSLLMAALLAVLLNFDRQRRLRSCLRAAPVPRFSR